LRTIIEGLDRDRFKHIIVQSILKEL
jgi:hypothetical protein